MCGHPAPSLRRTAQCPKVDSPLVEDHRSPDGAAELSEQAISADDVAADLCQVIDRWRASPELLAANAHIARSLRGTSPAAYSAECAANALELTSRAPAAFTAGDGTAHFCLVTKKPHIQTRRTLTKIVARLLAFGVRVHEICHVSSAGKVTQTLYPAAYRYFTGLPSDDTIWSLLDEQFGQPSFSSIFGASYSRDLVVTGRQAIDRFGISPGELTEIWETGRRPVSQEDLLRRYGETAASLVLDGKDSYQWFRGKWPLGIHRIGPGVMAFALRHERLAERAPIIIVNGHFPGLSELFGESTVIIRAGLASADIPIRHVRQWLVGHDNRPSACRPGSIRRDACDGVLLLDSILPVDSRKNVLHCSDGLVSGMIESQSLCHSFSSGGGLAAALLSSGLTENEIETIVGADPVVTFAGRASRLTELTEGQSLKDCTETVVRFVPPVFGPANGYASGVTMATLARELSKAISPGNKAGQQLSTDIRPLTLEPARRAELPNEDEIHGLRVISTCRAGVVVPAGGTGGRFGGYDLPESDLRRQKALVPCLRLGDRAASALDVRAANVKYWRMAAGGRIPMAVMGSPTNYELLLAWHEKQLEAGLDDIVIYRQFGTYRIRPGSRRPQDATGASWWVDRIVRHSDGTPNLKPPGNLGTLTCLALSGILDAWSRAGVEYIVIANGDDIGFRLDPRILGFLSRRTDIDAIVTAVPWGVQGEIRTSSGPRQVRADASGWCVIEGLGSGSLRFTGKPAPAIVFGGEIFPLFSPSFDIGGRLCEVAGSGGWRVSAAEGSTVTSLRPSGLLSTNQIYLRINALRNVMGLTGHDDIARAVCNFTDRLPFQVDQKAVMSGDSKIATLALSQAISSILRHISLAPVRISRAPDPGQYGGYSPLKTESDIAFGQQLLDDLASRGDHLA